MTSPNVSADLLRTLHRVQRQLADLRGRLDRGPRKVKNAEAHAANEEKKLEQTRDEYKAMRMAADSKQVQQKSGEAKVDELQLKLNTAGSNREYQALQEQIAAVKMANSVLDDEILEAWDRIETFKENVAKAEEDLEKAQAKAETVRKEVEEDEPKIKGDLVRLEGELKECEAGIPADVREIYNRTVRHRGEDALAAIDVQGPSGPFNCSGCYTQIPLNVVSVVKLGQPTFCKSCGRLLYFPEDGQPG
jgi:predicted  nucleic acid-binding Zn-ribbon protein